MNDLYKNTGEHIYVRIDGIYYKRTIGKGWAVISIEQAQAAVINWETLQDKQRAAFLPAIQEDTQT